MRSDLLNTSRAAIRPRVARRTHAIRFTKFRDRGRLKSSFPLRRAICRAVRYWSIGHNAVEPIRGKHEAKIEPELKPTCRIHHRPSLHFSV